MLTDFSVDFLSAMPQKFTCYAGIIPDAFRYLLLYTSMHNQLGP